MSTLSVPGFEILETLRQTSKTITLKAVQTSLDRTVALVFLRPELSSDATEVRRFLNTARVCSHLKSPSLPQIYDIASDGDRPYLVMEQVDGPSLSDLVNQKGPLAPTQAVRIIQSIAEALETAWKTNRVIHRNIKPSEIRIDARGISKLADFGRATVITLEGLAADDEGTGMIVGTPNFLSTEQAQGLAQIDFRSDMYALGATLYFALTGRVPFPDSDPETVVRKQIEEQIPHPRAFRPDLPGNICGLIIRLMMKLPEDRYASWNEALGDMQHVLRSQPLRRREEPFRGISTVAAYENEAPAVEAPRLRMVSKGTGTSTPVADALVASAAKDKCRTPAPLRATLWLLLALWFAALANERVGNPMKLPLPHPLLPLNTWEDWVVGLFAEPPAPPTPVKPVTPPPAPVPAKPLLHAITTPPGDLSVAAMPKPAPAPVAPTPVVTPSATPAPAPTPEPVQRPPVVPSLPQALPSDVTRNLASALASGNIIAARSALAGKINVDPDRLAEFRTAVAAIPDPQSLAEETLMRSRNQEVTITYMGKDRKIIPHSIVNGDISADYVSDEGKRPVTFKMSKFTPDEIVKLVPADSDKPAVQAAYCIALLTAGRKDDVGPHRVKCGVLAPIFEAAMQQ